MRLWRWWRIKEPLHVISKRHPNNPRVIRAERVGISCQESSCLRIVASGTKEVQSCEVHKDNVNEKEGVSQYEALMF